MTKLASDSNIERQEANHKPALLGIKVVMGFGVLTLVCPVFYAISNGTAPSAARELDLLPFGASVETYTPIPNVSDYSVFM